MALLRWRLWKNIGMAVPLILFFVRAGKKGHPIYAL